MRFHLRITLRNSGSSPRRTVIAGGTVFEVADPFAGTQNLATTAPQVVVLQPGSTQVVIVDSWCLNEPLAPPYGTAMRATAFRYVGVGAGASQDDVWDDLRRRR